MEKISYIIGFTHLIFSVILHEYAHGYVALKLGDNTAKNLGRLTLNPLKHIDPVMTVVLPLLLYYLKSPVIFGAAKPVPINARNFRNPISDMAIVAIAGPVVNLILCAFWSLLWIYIGRNPSPTFSDPLVGEFLMTGILINLCLALFNLIPIPPLDGGRILTAFLPKQLRTVMYTIEPYGFLIILLIMYTNTVQNYLKFFINKLISLLI